MTLDSSNARMESMRSRLLKLSPAKLEIVDESALHRGHAGAAGGAGHFRIHMICDRFAGLTRIARHRLVYDCLSDLMPTDIHALSLDLRTAHEAPR